MATPTTQDNDFIELDMDNPTSPKIVPTIPDDQLELDMVDRAAPACRTCGTQGPVDLDGLCERCFTARTTPDAAPEVPELAEAQSDFGSIAAETADTSTLGEFANGRATLGVGFHDAQGYVQAIARGVSAQTRAEYTETLRTRYGFTAEQIAGLAVGADFVVVEGGGAYEAETHTNDDAIEAFKAASAAKKAAAAALKAKNGNDGLVVAPTTEDTRVERLSHGNVVAGAVAEGQGVLTHWKGEGPLTIAQLAKIGEEAGIPFEWLPDAREPKSYASLAVKTAAKAAGLIVLAEKRDWRKKDQAYDHRWRLSAPATGTVTGESAGEVVLVVTLKAGELSFDVETEVSAQILAVYTDHVGREVLQAGHVTTWLGDVLRDHLGGCKYGGCWYVPAKSRATAESLIAAFETANWGTDWMNPPTPIATCQQLSKGIAKGLAAEVDEVLNDFAAQTAAQEAAKAADPDNAKMTGKIGERAAANFMAKFRTKAERTVAFAQLLGDELVRETKQKINDAIKVLDGLIDDGMGISQRYAAMWDEVEYDLKKADVDAGDESDTGARFSAVEL